MALQIRRGLQADLPASPADGELLYATDTNKLYVGDGGTAQEISGGGVANIVEDTTPQLGGDLDINGRSIVSTSNGNISINPNGTGRISLHGNLNVDNFGNLAKTGILVVAPTDFTSFGSSDTLIDGNIRIVRNTHSTATSQGFTFEQHHEVADAVNFNFVRTRGTGLIPLTVVNGDELSDMSFIGHDGTNRVSAAVLTARVGGPVSLGVVPGEFSFTTRNLVGAFGERAILSSEGVWKINSIENYSGTELTLTATTVKVAGHAQINAQNTLRFADSDSSNYVGFQAPATVAANVTWTLPGVDGANGQILTTNGIGVLSWTTSAGLASRASLPQVTTGLLVPNAYVTLSITGYKGYILYSIQTSEAAWIRLYSSTAAKDADSLRAEGIDPLPGSGVIAEIITAGPDTILMTPGVIGFSTESPPSTQIPCTITNKSGSTVSITVTVTALQLEL
jgi:hypothetical protein